MSEYRLEAYHALKSAGVCSVDERGYGCAGGMVRDINRLADQRDQLIAAINALGLGDQISQKISDNNLKAMLQ